MENKTKSTLSCCDHIESLQKLPLEAELIFQLRLITEKSLDYGSWGMVMVAILPSSLIASLLSNSIKGIMAPVSLEPSPHKPRHECIRLAIRLDHRAWVQTKQRLPGSSKCSLCSCPD